MDEMTKTALAVDLTKAAAAVTAVAVGEVSRQADLLMGGRKAPGDPGWEEWQGSAEATRWELAVQLVQLRLDLAVGLDPLPTVLGLRRWGVTWETIARAAGTSRQAAHERWGQKVLAILDAYGTGELGGPVADDERDLTGDR